MTVIRISDKAHTPEEVTTQLRKMADFIEAIASVKSSDVAITGELNLEVRFKDDSEEETAS